MYLFWQILPITSLILFIFMTCFFIISLKIQRNDIADIAWGFGFVFSATIAQIFLKNYFISEYSYIILPMIYLWGLRLTWHILKRNLKKEKEDYRYAKWRKDWGKWIYLRSFFQIYLLQGILLLIINSPIFFLLTQKNIPQGIYSKIVLIIGITIWIIGYLFEIIGDYQLKTFLKNPKNKKNIIQTGLWKYTRHPNYFGEITLWWGIFFICLSSFNINSLYFLISPLLITYLILYISGIPMLEKKLEKNPVYINYQKRTSKLIPWFPKAL